MPQDTYTTWAPISESEGWDRRDLLLPHPQMELARFVLQQTSTPVVVVLIHGGPVDINLLQQSPRVPAILTAWYPGQVRAPSSPPLHCPVSLHALPLQDWGTHVSAERALRSGLGAV